MIIDFFDFFLGFIKDLIKDEWEIIYFDFWCQEDRKSTTEYTYSQRATEHIYSLSWPTEYIYWDHKTRDNCQSANMYN